MPVTCPCKLPRLTTEQMRSLDFEVMKHAFASHSARGRLCDESVYQNDLAQRLCDTGIMAEIEVPVVLSFRDFETIVRIDLMVDQKAIYELKTVEKLTSKHEGQCLGYLFMNDATRGKLINLRPKSVETRFVNTSRRTSERRRFDFDATYYAGGTTLPRVVKELVEDWGTGLSATIYRKAILQCVGNDTAGEHLLPMVSDGVSLGKQRFHLLFDDTALDVTTFSDNTASNRVELHKLISTSPLSQLHWVNITHGKVQLTTIKNDRSI